MGGPALLARTQRRAPTRPIARPTLASKLPKLAEESIGLLEVEIYKHASVSTGKENCNVVSLSPRLPQHTSGPVSLSESELLQLASNCSTL